MMIARSVPDLLAGRRLHAERTKRGWAQAKLATDSSASPSTILAIEKYGYQPQPDTKARIAHALGVPAEAIWPAAARAAGVQEPRDG